MTSSAEYLVGQVQQHKTSAVIAIGVLVLAIAAIAYYLHARNTEVAIESIAVLPFENQNRDASVEWLSDGVTESIINNLAQLPNLRVSPRSTVFHYKGVQLDPLAVGKELGVRAVLSGRFLQTGDDVTISVELVDVRDNKQLWGDRFNHKVADALAMQQEISQQISERLRLKLSGTDQQKMMAKRNTTNAEAYQFYLKGRYFWNQRTAEGLRKAIEQFQHATDTDPNYALAYVGLADSYLVMEQYAGTPATETVPKARAAAERALQIDNSLAEAHTSMASIYEKLWKWDEAGEEYRRAISLNPNYPTARHWYYLYLLAMKRPDAEEQIRRAEELDPLSPVISLNVAHMYLRKGELDRAIEQGKRIIELYPSYPGGYEILANVYVKQRRYREAVEESSKAAELSGRASYYLGGLGFCYAQAGRRADALATLKELEAKYARRESAATDIAEVHVGLGDKDQAFVWLEKAFEARSGMLDDVTDEQYYDLLRDDPRYADLVHRMGLQP
jgi:TolB-like protein/Flp pilus assembly protein TadD